MQQIFLKFDKVPRTTAQQQKIAVVTGRVFKYDNKNLKATKKAYMDMLKFHVPKVMHKSAVSVSICYFFERPKSVKKNAIYKITRPDLDNLAKALLDVMTKLGFWVDDSLIARLHLTKKYAKGDVGIKILIDGIEDIDD